MPACFHLGSTHVSLKSFLVVIHILVEDTAPTSLVLLDEVLGHESASARQPLPCRALIDCFVGLNALFSLVLATADSGKQSTVPFPKLPLAFVHSNRFSIPCTSKAPCFGLPPPHLLLQTNDLLVGMLWISCDPALSMPSRGGCLGLSYPA